MSRGRWAAIGALAVAAIAFAVIAASGISDNLVYYWTPTDLHAAGNKAYGATIRLGGQVAPGSIRAHSGVSGLDFDVTDGKQMVHVRSNGVPPQMFREKIGVVVEGTMDKAGYFDGRRLMVSHSNEYRVPGDGEAVDVQKAMRSTQGLDERPKPKEP